ncbi:protein transport protein SEC31-like [Schistocerca americana]|uniref:protein transport protein SEC31-like n=1 Tax=Schistocerca americana TaxID=7009 RepID=UPI001F4F2324|nr:protein transport protein SEC31-like [Schistocerca americana]
MSSKTVCRRQDDSVSGLADRGLPQRRRRQYFNRGRRRAVVWAAEWRAGAAIDTGGSPPAAAEYFTGRGRSHLRRRLRLRRRHRQFITVAVLGTWYRDKCPGSRFLYCSRCYWGAQEASEPVAPRWPPGFCRSFLSTDLVRGGFQPRLPTSLPPPGQQQQPSPLPRRQPVPLMPPAQLHSGAPQVVAPAPAVPLQSPPPSELMDVDPSAGPPSQAVAVQPVLQPLSLGTPKESDTAAPCPAPTQQPSTQRQETLPLFVGPDAPSCPVPEAAPVVTAIAGRAAPVKPSPRVHSGAGDAPGTTSPRRRRLRWQRQRQVGFPTLNGWAVSAERHSVRVSGPPHAAANGKSTVRLYGGP